MQNVTEYYATGDAGLFINVGYGLTLVVFAWLFLSSYRALRAARQTLNKLKSLE